MAFFVVDCCVRQFSRLFFPNGCCADYLLILLYMIGFYVFMKRKQYNVQHGERNAQPEQCPGCVFRRGNQKDRDKKHDAEKKGAFKSYFDPFAAHQHAFMPPMNLFHVFTFSFKRQNSVDISVQVHVYIVSMPDDIVFMYFYLGVVVMPKLTFIPVNRSVQVRIGETILRAASRARVAISQRCGGKGACMMCKVQVAEGSKVSSPKELERRMIGAQNLARGIRLACQTRVQGETRVHLPESRLAAVVRAQLEKQRQELDEE